LVALGEADHLATCVMVVEEETLGVIEIVHKKSATGKDDGTMASPREARHRTQYSGNGRDSKDNGRRIQATGRWPAPYEPGSATQAEQLAALLLVWPPLGLHAQGSGLAQRRSGLAPGDAVGRFLVQLLRLGGATAHHGQR